MPQHFLDAGEFANGLRSLLLIHGFLNRFRFLLGNNFLGSIHNTTSGSLFKQGGKSLARPMQFAADRIGGLFGKIGYLLVAQLFISNEQ